MTVLDQVQSDDVRSDRICVGRWTGGDGATSQQEPVCRLNEIFVSNFLLT